MIESKLRIDPLAALAPVGIFLARPDGEVIDSNSCLCELAGMTKAQLQGFGWQEVLHPEDRVRILEKWNAAAAGNAEFADEFRLLTPKGKVRWVCRTAEAIFDAAGRITAYIGIVADITESKLAELALAEANRRMQAVLNASPVSIIGLDLEARVTAWNRTAEVTFGWSEQEALGRFPPFVPEEELPDLIATLRRGAASGPRGAIMHARRNRAGKTLQVSITTAPLLDGHGKKIGGVAVLEDVTARERTQQQLDGLLDEQERLAEDLHDSCIQSIYAIGLDLQESRRLVADEAAKVKIANAVAQLNLVIGDLRGFITGERRRLPDGPELANAFKRTIELMGDRARTFAHVIDAAAVNALTADQAEHLLQIVRAALSNCARHAKAVTGRVTLGLQGESIRLEVADDGVGFNPQATEIRHGLGLHNMLARARKIGGLLTVDSAPGCGTRIVVAIPRAQSA